MTYVEATGGGDQKKPLNENRDIDLIANNIGKINLVEKIDLEPKSSQEKPKDNKKTDVFKKGEKLEDCFVLDKNGQLNCNYCNGKYQREGHMHPCIFFTRTQYFSPSPTAGTNILPHFFFSMKFLFWSPDPLNKGKLKFLLHF